MAVSVHTKNFLSSVATVSLGFVWVHSRNRSTATPPFRSLMLLHLLPTRICVPITVALILFTWACKINIFTLSFRHTLCEVTSAGNGLPCPFMTLNYCHTFRLRGLVHHLHSIKIFFQYSPKHRELHHQNQASLWNSFSVIFQRIGQMSTLVPSKSSKIHAKTPQLADSGKTRNEGNGNGEAEMREWKWRNGNGEAETSYTN